MNESVLAGVQIGLSLSLMNELVLAGVQIGLSL